MELRHLRYFIAVSDAGSFTRAAESLGIQQPPLSQQIKALELELGFPLLLRNSKGVVLTVGGRVFLEESRRLLAGLDQAAQLATNAARGSTGHFSIGFTTSAITHRLVPRLIRAFRSSYPDVEIEIQEGSAARLTESLLGRSLDIGMLRTPVAHPPGVQFRTLLKEQMLLVMPSRHPLATEARRKSRVLHPTISLIALKDEPFILVRRPGGPGMYSDLIDACERLGFTPKIAMEVENMLTNVALVAAGVGVSAVPASLQRVHGEDVLFLLPKEAPQLKAPLTLAFHEDNRNPAAQRFMDFSIPFVKGEQKSRRELSTSGQLTG